MLELENGPLSSSLGPQIQPTVKGRDGVRTGSGPEKPDFSYKLKSGLYRSKSGLRPDPAWYEI